MGRFFRHHRTEMQEAHIKNAVHTVGNKDSDAHLYDDEIASIQRASMRLVSLRFLTLAQEEGPVQDLVRLARILLMNDLRRTQRESGKLAALALTNRFRHEDNSFDNDNEDSPDDEEMVYREMRNRLLRVARHGLSTVEAEEFEEFCPEI
jgi:hypothetical protein